MLIFLKLIVLLDTHINYLLLVSNFEIPQNGSFAQLAVMAVTVSGEAYQDLKTSERLCRTRLPVNEADGRMEWNLLPEFNHVIHSTLTQFFPLPNVVHFVDRERLLLHRKERLM